MIMFLFAEREALLQNTRSSGIQKSSHNLAFQFI